MINVRYVKSLTYNSSTNIYVYKTQLDPGTLKDLNKCIGEDYHDFHSMYTSLGSGSYDESFNSGCTTYYDGTESNGHGRYKLGSLSGTSGERTGRFYPYNGSTVTNSVADSMLGTPTKGADSLYFGGDSQGTTLHWRALSESNYNNRYEHLHNLMVINYSSSDGTQFSGIPMQYTYSWDIGTCDDYVSYGGSYKSGCLVISNGTNIKLYKDASYSSPISINASSYVGDSSYMLLSSDGNNFYALNPSNGKVMKFNSSGTVSSSWSSNVSSIPFSRVSSSNSNKSKYFGIRSRYFSHTGKRLYYTYTDRKYKGTYGYSYSYGTTNYEVAPVNSYVSMDEGRTWHDTGYPISEITIYQNSN